MNKKYIMIVTSEDERYGTEGYQLSYWSDNPWDGLFVDAVCGDTEEELFEQGDYEGLFYQLYSNETGERISYGMIDCYISEEFDEYERK